MTQCLCHRTYLVWRYRPCQLHEATWLQAAFVCDRFGCRVDFLRQIQRPAMHLYKELSLKNIVAYQMSVSYLYHVQKTHLGIGEAVKQRHAQIH